MTPRFALGFLCCALGVVALTFADGARLVARCIAGPYAGAAPLEALERPAPALVAWSAARRAAPPRGLVRGVGDRAAAKPLERAADPVASSAARSSVAGSRPALGAGPAASLAPELFASFALARELAP